MALRARLVTPRTAPDKTWQWHSVKYTSIPASVLFSGDRRMEAETYLSSGYGIRVAIESKQRGWVRFDQVAKVEQPNRLKGILVSPEYGKPFLAATQVFDVRPISRKFLAIEKMEGARSCYVKDGTIMVTRSGSVGRPTVAHNVHEGIVISDDLLRVKAINPKESGWIYAYLHAVQTRAMTKGAQYGHMIKHLEVSHLEALPIPLVDQRTAEEFTQKLAQIVSLRNDSYRLTLEAEKRFEEAFAPVEVED
jgi:type I restriction enzyme, S subunit